MYRFLFLLAAILAGLVVAACSGVEMKPGTQARNNNDIRQGPGVLTESKGEFVISRIEDEPDDEEEADDEDESNN